MGGEPLRIDTLQVVRGDAFQDIQGAGDQMMQSRLAATQTR